MTQKQRKIGIDPVYTELKKLEEKVDNLTSVQSDMRDAILILTENQKKLQALQEQQTEHTKQLQGHEVRLALAETALANTSEKLKGIPEAKLVNRAVIFISGLIATGLVALTYKVVAAWITS